MEINIPDSYKQLFNTKNGVVKYPSAILRQIAEPVKNPSDVQKLISKMSDILRITKGVGLSAQQAGGLSRVILGRRQNRYALLNPVIEEVSGSFISEEGCLSIPGLWGNVIRHESIVLRGTSPHGKEVVLELSGTEAAVPQHEIDHLDGILFIDRAIQESLHWFSPKVGKRLDVEFSNSE